MTKKLTPPKPALLASFREHTHPFFYLLACLTAGLILAPFYNWLFSSWFTLVTKWLGG